MSALSTSSLSVELLSQVIDVKYGCFTFYLYHLHHHHHHHHITIKEDIITLPTFSQQHDSISLPIVWEFPWRRFQFHVFQLLKDIRVVNRTQMSCAV